MTRVLDFSRPNVFHLQRTDVNAPIQNALKLASTSLRKAGIEIEANLAKDLPEVFIDPQLIVQVMLNVITNAAEAITSIDGTKKLSVTTVAQRHHVLLEVGDSGPGVPDDIRGKIFQPFFTSKRHGAGLGLAVCERIIADHGGSMELSRSKLGGAGFLIRIPNEKRMVAR